MDIYDIGYRDGLKDGLKQSAETRDDLLAALEAIKAVACQNPQATDRIYDLAQAAIAKAEGR